MEVDLDGVWAKLDSFERLSREEEEAFIYYLQKNFTKEAREAAGKVITVLRARAFSRQETSIEELKKFYEEVKCFNIKAASENIDAMIINEWKGIFINAQANRIENACKKFMDEMRKTWSAYREGKELEEVLEWILSIEKKHGNCACEGIVHTPS